MKDKIRWFITRTMHKMEGNLKHVHGQGILEKISGNVSILGKEATLDNGG